MRVCNISLGDGYAEGMPIVFQGNEVGRIIKRLDDGRYECAIDSDIVASWMSGGKCSFSLEVTKG